MQTTLLLNRPANLEVSTVRGVRRRLTDQMLALTGH